MDVEPEYVAPELDRWGRRLVARAMLRDAVREAGPQLRLAYLEHRGPGLVFWAACDRVWARVSGVLG